ncbi:10289_t:CDS:2 [Ambispora leptoticha]|uniref:10289_t:CDS:1 n=1 Tax=Ambispora leptoticha TaxID=144679 RepID=A0A9N8ZP96_9GLOM|nr:10289_t:CDS:2 [Ambispora leptoticha]
MSDERIVLNVGGIKYETFKSTLISQPNTLLGRLFKENSIKPSKENEYFFDRNGRAFHYVLEYYRTGSIHIPRENAKEYITGGKGAPLSSDILAEFDYFEIIPKDLSLQNRALAIRVDELIQMFKDIYFEMAARMVSEFNVRFDIDGSYFIPCEVNKLVGSSAYAVLEQFSKDIEAHLNSSFPGLTSKFTHHPNGFKYPDDFTVPLPHFNVSITLNKDFYDFDAIRNTSCLRSRDP